jgi:hypothetical protein
MTMRALRPVIAADPRFFGRRGPDLVDEAQDGNGTIGDDLKLFGSTFAIGFLFVSVLIF